MKTTTSAIILAAGKGTRMKSDLPKVLHQVCGKPMVTHIIDKLKEVGIQDIIVVVGHKADMVQDVIGNGVKYAVQTEQKGTGHAVMQAAPLLNENGETLIITGDTPLIEQGTISSLIEEHRANRNAGTVLITKFDNPTGYGRIIRDQNKQVVGIVEEKDADLVQKNIKEVNTGIFCFDNNHLIEGLPLLTNHNSQNEFYLTDMVSILGKQGVRFGSYLISDNEQVMGINDKEQLLQAEYVLLKNRSFSLEDGQVNKKTI
ncbi:NTP transferase domain-containing protein [[Brevibacterium] frigoritolerans]|nr:NTP transferase domain-containing protein [Peribacillus frigoritolerans]